MSKIWNVITKLANLGPLREPLKKEEMANPDSPVVRNILYLHTMEMFLYHALNQASRVQDAPKVQTLGPFSMALSLIFRSGSEEIRKV